MSVLLMAARYHVKYYSIWAALCLPWLHGIFACTSPSPCTYGSPLSALWTFCSCCIGTLLEHVLLAAAAGPLGNLLHPAATWFMHIIFLIFSPVVTRTLITTSLWHVNNPCVGFQLLSHVKCCAHWVCRLATLKYVREALCFFQTPQAPL